MTRGEAIVEINWVKAYGFKPYDSSGRTKRIKESTKRIKESFDMATEALEKADKYRWHDLRKDPEDLPNYNNHYSDEILFVNERKDYLQGGFLSGTTVENEYCIMEDVVAWKYIEPFEVEE